MLVEEEISVQLGVHVLQSITIAKVQFQFLYNRVACQQQYQPVAEKDENLFLFGWVSGDTTTKTWKHLLFQVSSKYLHVKVEGVLAVCITTRILNSVLHARLLCAVLIYRNRMENKVTCLETLWYKHCEAPHSLPRNRNQEGCSSKTKKKLFFCSNIQLSFQLRKRIHHH